MAVKFVEISFAATRLIEMNGVSGGMTHRPFILLWNLSFPSVNQITSLFSFPLSLSYPLPTTHPSVHLMIFLITSSITVTIIIN